jgi:hypothetical protein
MFSSPKRATDLAVVAMLVASMANLHFALAQTFPPVPGPFPLNITSSAVPKSKHATRYAYQKVENKLSTYQTYMEGINRAGVISGSYVLQNPQSGTPLGPQTGSRHGFLFYPPYKQKNFDPVKLPNRYSDIFDITDAGEIAGALGDESNGSVGFIRRKGKITTYSPGGRPLRLQAIIGLSDNGLAVGQYLTAKGKRVHFHLNIRTGKYSKIFPSSSGLSDDLISAAPPRINNKGHVVGCYSDAKLGCFLIKGSVIRNFSTPGCSNPAIRGIKNDDTVVGQCVVDGANVGYVLSNPGGNSVAQLFFPPQAGPAVFFDLSIDSINNRGELLGHIEQYLLAPNLPSFSYNFIARPA